MYIEKLDNNGRGICYIDGKITFVENALIDEDVEVKVISEKKKYNEAKVIRYNKTSIDRIDVLCPYFNLCGGCDLLHLKHEKQLEFKLKKVKDILKKFGDIEIDIKNIISVNEFNYRNKATFQVNEKIGYYKKKSYEIVEIDNCLIVDNKINEILTEIKKLSLKNIYQFMIRVSKNTNDTMLLIKCNGPIDEGFKKLDITSIYTYLNGEYNILKGTDYIIEKMNDLSFVISPDSFFQVNTDAALKLYNQVLEYAKLSGTENVLDLYCGTGTIGIFLSKYADSVLGIEINESAVNDAIYNKKINHIRNIDFICEDVEKIQINKFDLVIVDPPRKGLNKKTINQLINLKIKKIIYVSCDPVTLARDLNNLKELYNIKDITLFDMFPNTEHCESIAILERR